MSTLTKALVWILTPLVVSCASGQIDSLEYPLSDIKVAAKAFFNNSLKEIESGGRDYKTDYFRPNLSKGKVESPLSEDLVRAIATVRFIGNERPYSIETWVEVEEKQKNVWVNQGIDSQLSKKLAQLLGDYIRTRRDKNVIDHFRPF